MYRPVLVTPPAIKPLTLAEAKAHLRLDHTDDDPTVTALIAAVTAHLDGWTGILRRCLCEQTWLVQANTFHRCMRLPLFPVISLTSVGYTDQNGEAQPVDGSSYDLRTDDFGSYVRFFDDFSAPALSSDGAAVSITAKYGYADTAGDPVTSSVPADLKAAMLLLIAHWFENRQAVVLDGSPVALPMAVDALIAPHRRIAL
jgi:uncharacterized phiE125 gp8 family phage protein